MMWQNAKVTWKYNFNILSVLFDVLYTQSIMAVFIADEERYYS